MKTTNYPGIDYSLGKSNYDPKTGIHYGMISQHYVMPEALDDVFNGRDLGLEQAESDLKDKLRRALSDYFSDYKHDGKASRLDQAVDDAFDALDGWADNLEPSGPYLYESEETIRTAENGELWILKSPFYTHAQFCSPCVPGAGNLDSPCPSGPKTYCLSHDWFDGGIAPYPVFSVATGEEIKPQTINP